MSWRPDQLEEVPCDACGGRVAREVIIRPDGMRVVECVACGLAYLNPRPKTDQVHLLYDAAYFGCGPKKSDIGYEAYAQESSRTAHEATAMNLLDVVGGSIGLAGRRALEIGCATGEFCQALRARGCSVVGIDLSSEVVAMAKARYPQLDLRPGDLETAVRNETFDVIFAWEVVEHVASPLAFFAQISRRLLPQGFFILSTPNYACSKRVQPHRWAGFQYSFEHLYFFDRRAIENLASRHGLRHVMSYSGGGAGLPPKPQRFRAVVRSILSSTGTLQTVRRLRTAANPHGIGYSPGREDQHTLILILQKDAAGMAQD